MFSLKKTVGLIVTLLAVSAIGYWFYHRSSPTVVVEKYLSALISGDFKSAYDLMGTPSKKYIDFPSFEAYQHPKQEKPWKFEKPFLKTKSTDHITVGFMEVHADDKAEGYLDLVLEQRTWRVAHTNTLWSRADDLQKDSNFSDLLTTIDQMREIAPWDGGIVGRRIKATMSAAQAIPTGVKRSEAIEKVMESARETLKQWPNDYSVQSDMAMVFHEAATASHDAKLYKDAENTYSRALVLASEPKQKALVLLGRLTVKMSQNRIADAVSDAKEALRLAPDDDAVRVTVAMLMPFAASVGVDLSAKEAAVKNDSVATEQNVDNQGRRHYLRDIVLGFVTLFVIAIAVFFVLAWKRYGTTQKTLDHISGMAGVNSKKGFIIACSIAMAIAAVGIWYWQYTKSPQYSLRIVAKAVKQHDITTFEKYTDVDGLVNRAIDQLMDQATQKAAEPTNVWEKIGTNFAKGLVGMVKPRMVQSVKEQIGQYIERGKLENTGKVSESQFPLISIKSVYGKISGEKNGFKGVQYVKEEGKIAYVGLGFYREDFDKTLVLELKMRDKGGYWQIAEITNFPDLLKQVNALEVERLAKLNRPTIEAMKKALVIMQISKQGKSTDSWGIGKAVVFSVNLMNLSPKDISAFQLTIKSGAGKVLSSINTTNSQKLIPPGKPATISWQQQVNMFDKDATVLFSTPQEALKMTADIQYLKFSDGSELKLL